MSLSIPATTSPGDSKEQREAGNRLLEILSSELGLRQGLQKKKFELAKGAYLELDGYTEKPLIFCESWAHIGEVKSAQQAKVMQDAVRLVYARKLTGRNARCILLFGDDVAANHFRGKKWVAWCLRALDIEVRVVHLPNSLRQKVLKAQERQYR